MRITSVGFLSGLMIAFFSSVVFSFPGSPKESSHPGSKIYGYGVQEKTIKCLNRDVTLFLPTSETPNQTFPAVVYGHGQALALANYKNTFEHLAKKGVAAIYPTYDTGFFDRDWERMGEDFVNQAHCAVTQAGGLIQKDQIVFSGHSKGAYVASIAAGLAFKKNLNLKPSSVVLFAAAGVDESSLRALDPSVEMTVVFSDSDSVVSKDLSDRTFRQAPSLKKQFIFVKSYPQSSGKAIKADHFWPVTKSSLVGGGPETELHYYGAWKWLVAAGWDVAAGGQGTQEFLYGNLSTDKGVTDLSDDIQRSW